MKEGILRDKRKHIVNIKEINYKAISLRICCCLAVFICFFCECNCVVKAQNISGFSEIYKQKNISLGQDAACWNGYIFRFNHNGSCKVYDATSFSAVCSFKLDKSDLLMAHSNSACFGATKYSEKDEFPLLYCNVYNNYYNKADKRYGTCCVYRIIRSGNIFTSQLVQVIKIGFVNDYSLWSSNTDKRPFGNFLIDYDNNILYAYTMIDKTNTTRFFKFSIPSLNVGDYDNMLNCNIVTLKTNDILDSFDTEYSYCLQGGCYYDNKLFLLEGFIENGKFRILDLKQRRFVLSYNISDMFFKDEPEMITQYNGVFYYSDATGNLYTFHLANSHIWDSGVIVREATYESPGIKRYTCRYCGKIMEEEVPALERTSINSCIISGITDKTYNGKYRTQNIIIKDKGKQLKIDKDYKISYKNNKKAGIARIYIRGIGNYKDSVVETFKIKPREVKIIKMSTLSGKVLIKWNKAECGTGYEIQFKTKGANKYKRRIIKNLRTYKSTIKNLKKGKIYYFRIRVYKKVNSSMICSRWSKVKKIKIK